ncbi:hypothetical protein [Pseudohaliea sp.]|uniref:YybH family protein n=1 Tax=Pseudohaliea sp. TaxID=2740289 RepID=UPI0032EF12C2
MALTPDSLNQVREAAEEVMACYSGLDAAKLAEHCTEDFVLVRPETGIQRPGSADAVREFLHESLCSFQALHVDFEIVDISGEEGLAYVLMPNRDEFTLAGEEEPTVVGGATTLMIFERQRDRRWKLKLQMCSVPAPDEQGT